jgi:signal transduction histidine kinase
MMSESARGELADPGLAPWGKDQPCQPSSGPDYPTGQAAKKLEKIYDTARELTRSMDEIVWAVSPRHDTLESLATYLEKFAHDWLATVGIRCRLDLPLQFPERHLTSEVRHNVFLAFKEALHNAVKHSGATEVLIRLAVKEKSFELAIEDNGRGFAAGEKAMNAPSAQGRAASGNGLENMERRLAAIGGSCEIQSTPGVGTKVRFSVQLKASAGERFGR